MDKIQQRLKEEEQDKLLHEWLTSDKGKMALEILKYRHYDVPTFDENPLEMARLAGRREVIEEFIDTAEGD